MLGILDGQLFHPSFFSLFRVTTLPPTFLPRLSKSPFHQKRVGLDLEIFRPRCACSISPSDGRQVIPFALLSVLAVPFSQRTTCSSSHKPCRSKQCGHELRNCPNSISFCFAFSVGSLIGVADHRWIPGTDLFSTWGIDQPAPGDGLFEDPTGGERPDRWGKTRPVGKLGTCCQTRGSRYFSIDLGGEDDRASWSPYGKNGFHQHGFRVSIKLAPKRGQGVSMNHTLRVRQNTLSAGIHFSIYLEDPPTHPWFRGWEHVPERFSETGGHMSTSMCSWECTHCFATFAGLTGEHRSSFGVLEVLVKPRGFGHWRARVTAGCNSYLSPCTQRKAGCERPKSWAPRWPLLSRERALKLHISKLMRLMRSS